ncbi:hypothetical protein WA577_002238 [Blastocystis sp. JDR]
MSEQGGECIESSMKPYMDDYQSTVDGVLQRQKALLAEFSSLTDDINKLSKKAHIDELTRIVRCLTETQQNLESAGSLLQSIEKRVESIEKTLGVDDYDLWCVCSTESGIQYNNR